MVRDDDENGLPFGGFDQTESDRRSREQVDRRGRRISDAAAGDLQPRWRGGLVIEGDGAVLVEHAGVQRGVPPHRAIDRATQRFDVEAAADPHGAGDEIAAARRIELMQ